MQKRISLTRFPSSNASKKNGANSKQNENFEQELCIKLGHNYIDTKFFRSLVKSGGHVLFKRCPWKQQSVLVLKTPRCL